MASASLTMQEGAFLASLGMQCQTGSCIYNSTHPEPPGPPAPPAPPPLPPHEHHDVAAEIITLISIGLVVSLGMILGGFLIYQDSRLSQERYKAWSEGETQKDWSSRESSSTSTLACEQHSAMHRLKLLSPQLGKSANPPGKVEQTLLAIQQTLLANSANPPGEEVCEQYASLHLCSA